MNVSDEVFACYEKACAPPPAGRGGSSKGGRTFKMNRYEMSLMWGLQNRGRVQIATTADAKRLVREGLVESTQEIPLGIRNIGNSKRWKLTEVGKEFPKVVLDKGRYSLPD